MAEVGSNDVLEGVRHARETVESAVETTSHVLKHQLENARHELETVDHQVRSFARERPFLAIGAAVAFGYLVGRFASRR